MRRPNFFIVGAAKSGTTSMHRYLAQHPDISMPQKREPIFFGRDLSSHARKTKSADDYLNLFAGCGSEKIVGEKTVWYLYSKTAAEEIRDFDKNAKIMIMLRNPVDMVHSLHQQFLSTGNEDVRSFEEAIALIDERAAGRHIPPNAPFPEGLVYTRIPLYSEQVARYLRVFGRDQVQIIIFDDLATRPETIYAEALDFLGVSGNFVLTFSIYNKKKKPRSKLIDAFVQSPPAFIPEALRRPLQWRLQRLNSVPDKRLATSKEMRANLQETFKPDVERLSELLGRDLTHWCEAKHAAATGSLPASAPGVLHP